MPDGVLRSPFDDPSLSSCRNAELPSFPSLRTDRLSLRPAKAPDGSHEMSSSGSSSPVRKLPFGLVGRKVSCDDDGDILPALQKARFGAWTSPGGSGVSVRYFRVVEGNLAIVLLSDVLLLRRRMGFDGRLLFEVFIRITLSSDEESSSPTAQSSSSSSSSPSLSTAMHCSTLSSNRMCFFSLSGECRPEVDREESDSTVSLLVGFVDASEGMKSEVFRFKVCGLLGRYVCELPCCAWTAAAACITNDEDERDFCSMTSEALRFFRIGFLVKKELFLDKLLHDSDAFGARKLELVCKGP